MSYSTYLSNQLKLSSEVRSLRGMQHVTQDITANVTTGSSQLDPQTQFILGILQRSKITLDYCQDPKTKQSAAKKDLSVNVAAPITLQGFQDNDNKGLVTIYNANLLYFKWFSPS